MQFWHPVAKIKQSWLYLYTYRSACCCMLWWWQGHTPCTHLLENGSEYFNEAGSGFKVLVITQPWKARGEEDKGKEGRKKARVRAQYCPLARQTPSLPMACVSPLSMLAVSMLDMAKMVASLSATMWRWTACFLIWFSLLTSMLFSACTRFMKDVKYLRRVQQR